MTAALTIMPDQRQALEAWLTPLIGGWQQDHVPGEHDLERPDAGVDRDR